MAKKMNAYMKKHFKKLVKVVQVALNTMVKHIKKPKPKLEW